MTALCSSLNCVPVTGRMPYLSHYAKFPTDWNKKITPRAFLSRDIVNSLHGLKFRGVIKEARSFSKGRQRVCPRFEKFAIGEGIQIEKLNKWNTPADMSSAAAYQGLSKFVEGRSEPFQLTAEAKDALVMAATQVEAKLTPYMGQGDFKSVEDVVQSADHSAAPGFPWSSDFGNKKSDVFATSEWRPIYDEYFNVELLKETGEPSCVWSSALKRELRAYVDGVQKNPRQINGAPLEHTLALNQYCLGQNELMYEHHGKFDSQVGMDVYNGGWAAMRDRLRDLAQTPEERETLRYLQLDAKSWDATVIRELLVFVRDMRWRWLLGSFRRRGTPMEEVAKHKTRFFRLYGDLIESVLKGPKGDLWQKFWAVVSGGGNTVNDNTIAIMIVLRAIWFMVFGYNLPMDVASSSAEYGDDTMMAVLEPYRKAFNADRVIEEAKKFGVTLKNEASDVDEHGYVSDAAVSFLKKKSMWIGKIEVFTPEEPLKLIHALAFSAGVDETLAITFSRAVSVRNMLFNTPYFDVADDYANALAREADAEATLRHDPEIVGIRSALLSPRALFAHLSGVKRTSGAPALETLTVWKRESLKDIIGVCKSKGEQQANPEEESLLPQRRVELERPALVPLRLPPRVRRDPARLEGVSEEKKEAGAPPALAVSAAGVEAHVREAGVAVATGFGVTMSTPVQCNHCGKPGHRAAACWTRLAQERNKAQQPTAQNPPSGPGQGQSKKARRRERQRSLQQQKPPEKIVNVIVRQVLQVADGGNSGFVVVEADSDAVTNEALAAVGVTRAAAQFRLKSATMKVAGGGDGVTMAYLGGAAIDQPAVTSHAATRIHSASSGNLEFKITGASGWVERKRVFAHALAPANSIVEVKMDLEVRAFVGDNL